MIKHFAEIFCLTAILFHKMLNAVYKCCLSTLFTIKQPNLFQPDQTKKIRLTDLQPNQSHPCWPGHGKTLQRKILTKSESRLFWRNFAPQGK